MQEIEKDDLKKATLKFMQELEKIIQKLNMVAKAVNIMLKNVRKIKMDAF